MKKLFWICLALSVVLGACQKTPVVTTAEATTVTTPRVTVQTTEPIVTQPIEPEFTIVTVSPNLGAGVAVSYEVLKTGDEALDDLLAKAAATEFARHIPNASSVSANGGSADYYVKMTGCYADDSIIAAIFGGEYSLFFEDGSGAEENGDVFYTVLIDPTEKKLLDSADIVSDFDKLKQAFADGKFAAFGIPPYAEDLTQYRTEYGIYPYVSFDADNFYLYISASGMSEFTTQYSIPRVDARDFLNEKYQ